MATGAMNEVPQGAVFAFLQDARTHGGATVSRIDTHAASVFLAGARAYKVKHAVSFPFLDYSTLEKRKAACEAELEVNRRFAPLLYRRVVAVTREPDGRLALGGKGRPVEWVVEMARFDESRTLDRLAARGELDAGLAARLGAVVAATHADASMAAGEPWIEAVAAYIEQNDAALRERPDIFAVEQVDALTQASRADFAAVRPLMVVRGNEGLIRRGHGDLHLGNIVLIQDEPTLFDAIEFDAVVASGDVLYDLAFLLMDLIHGGRSELANHVFNAYLAASRRLQDLAGLRLLPLFLSLRAAIRAKVTASRIGTNTRERNANTRERNEVLAAGARTYFDLACRLIAPARPQLVTVGGLSGTGKTTLARGFAPALMPAPGAVLLRSDVERKALFGIAETAALPPQAYAREVTVRVYELLRDKARRVLSAGHSVVVDAVFAHPQERQLFGDLASECAVRFTGLFLIAGLSARIRRVESRRADASDAGQRVVQTQESYDLGALEWAKIDASGTAETTLARARAALGIGKSP